MSASRSARAVWAILRKECRSEWRTRYGLNAALLFSVTTLTAVSFAAGRLSDRTDMLSLRSYVQGCGPVHAPGVDVGSERQQKRDENRRTVSCLEWQYEDLDLSPMAQDEGR